MLNVQTEHLENHTARLTVDLDPERLERAMRQTARQLAKRGRIPGFRPGKAPFNVVLNMYGREYVLSETLEKLGNEVYREALEAAEIDPYAPGSLEDITEEGHKLVFVVPKVPTIDLGDYRAIRADYEENEVTDEMVNDVLENLREEQAVVEDVDRAAEIGDQIEMAHIEIVMLPSDEDEAADADEAEEADEAADEDEAADTDEAEADEDETVDADEDDDEPDEEVLLHQHNFTRVLEEDPERDMFPGFSAHLVGLSAEDEIEFELELPEDFEEERLAGRTLRCEVHVEKVQSRTLPEWTDDLAKRVSEEKFETLLDLRMDVRKQLETQAENEAQQACFEAALEQIVEGADFHYPAELIEDHIADLMSELDNSLRQRGLTLDDYLNITSQTREAFSEQHREPATQRAQRTLVLSEFITQEHVTVSEDDIEAHINEMIENMGGDNEEEANRFRQFFDMPGMRDNVGNQLLHENTVKRLVAIARGENPPIEEPPSDEDAAEAEADADADAEIASEGVDE